MCFLVYELHEGGKSFQVPVFTCLTLAEASNLFKWSFSFQEPALPLINYILGQRCNDVCVSIYSKYIKLCSNAAPSPR